MSQIVLLPEQATVLFETLICGEGISRQPSETKQAGISFYNVHFHQPYTSLQACLSYPKVT